MAELADALDLGSSIARCEGSNPFGGTMEVQDYQKYASICNKGKHKIRENKFGVCWCTRCGHLFSNVPCEKLDKDDIVCMKSKT